MRILILGLLGFHVHRAIGRSLYEIFVFDLLATGILGTVGVMC